MQPGKEYAWGVQAMNGITAGPYAGFSYFFTGPMCETAALVAPALLQPVNYAIINNLNPTLIWQYPNPCLPEGYRVDLSTDVTFADTSLSGGTGNPSTCWGPGEPLADCTVYFWKIAPINGTTLGPASGLFSFITDVNGTCPTPTPVGPSPTPIGPSATPVEPTFTPTPVELTFTPTPLVFFFTPNFNAYCRFGPNISFPWFDVAMKGQSYLMDGRNLANDWFRIMITASKGCWVLASSGTPSKDPSGLRVLAEVPTFTATPVALCSQFTTRETCKLQYADCVWVPSTTHPGDCVSK